MSFETVCAITDLIEGEPRKAVVSGVTIAVVLTEGEVERLDRRPETGGKVGHVRDPARCTLLDQAARPFRRIAHLQHVLAHPSPPCRVVVAA